jgi:hypothetical protein
MAILTAKKSGKASEAATWTPEEAPTTTSELVVPTGRTVEIAAALTVVSAKTEGTGTFNLAKNLSLSGAGTSLNLSASTVLGGTGAIVIRPGTGATAEPITNGVAIPALTHSQNKLTLKENLTVTGLFTHKAGTFTTNSHAVTLGSYEAESASAKELVLGSSLVKLTSGGFNAPSSVGLTITPETSKLEFTAAATLQAGGHIFNVVTATGNNFAINGGGTFGALNLLLSGSERLCIFEDGTTTTVTSLTKSAGPLTLRSAVPGNRWKIKAAGTITLEEVSIKDSTAETGTFKDINGTDLGGNTGWTFVTAYTDARSGTITASGTRSESFTAVDTRTAAIKATGVRSDSFAAIDSGTGTIKASGTRVETYRASDAATGQISLSGSGADAQSFSDTHTGTIKASGTATATYSAVDSQTGTIALTGTGAESWSHLLNYSDSATGTARLTGSSTDAYRATDPAHGEVRVSGTGHDSYGHFDVGFGHVTVSGTATAATSYVDSLVGLLHLQGSATDSFTTPLRPALVTLTLRHTARIEVTPRR